MKFTVKSSLPFWLFMVLAAWLWGSGSPDPAAAAESPLPTPSPDEVALMKKAMPPSPAVEPKHPRRLLVVELSKGYRHASIPYWSRVLVLMGEQTGAYTAEVTTDLTRLKPESLREFDAVCFNNTTRLAIEDPEIRTGLMDFLKGGKGIIGIHAATDNFYNWPEMAAVMGGTFIGHPWTAGGTWTARIDDPDHPLMAAFRDPQVLKRQAGMNLPEAVFQLTESGFRVQDEIYRTRAPLYSRTKLRVLMSLDMTAPENLKPEQVKPDDRDIGLSWIRNVGNGRLFYGSLGHNPHITWIPVILRHYLDGIQFALGDLEVEARPPFSLAMEAIAKYAYGDNREPLAQISDAVRATAAMPESRALIEQAFIDFLKSDASLAGKSFICRQLSLVGSDACISTLAAMLPDPKTSDIARYTLESLEGEKVDAALRNALNTTSGREQIGIIGSLGQRRDAKAVPALSNLVFNQEDPQVAAAAIAALGQIATPDAIRSLQNAKDSAGGELRDQLLDAYLRCADTLADAGRKAEAMEIYREVFRPEEPEMIRNAALRGMVFVAGEDAADLLTDVLSQDNPEMQSAAISLAANLKDPAVTAMLAAQLPRLAPRQQIQLLAALGERGDPKAAPAVVKMLTSPNPEVRETALQQLATLGNASTVPILAQTAAHAEGNEQKQARESLYRLRGTEIDREILRRLESAEPPEKVELITAAGERGIEDAVPLLLQAAARSDRSVRREALAVVAELGDPPQIPKLLELLQNASGSSDRRGIEKAVTSILHRSQNEGIASVVAAARRDAEPEVTATLVAILGATGSPEALPVLQNALTSSDPGIWRAATRALAEWPTAKPMPQLLDIAASTDDLSRHVLAMRSYIALAGRPDNRSVAASVDLLRRALQTARRPEEKTSILGLLPKFAGPEALNLAESQLSDPTLAEEAQLTLNRIREAMAAQP